MDEGSIIRMLEMLGSGSRIKRTGTNIIASCPLGGHQDKNPSFTIKVNASGPSSWNCYSCGSKANKTISLLYKIQENGGGWRSDIHQMIKDSEYGSAVSQVSRLKDWRSQKLQKNNEHAGRKVYSSSGYAVQGYEPKFNVDDYKEIMTEVPKYILDRGFTPATCIKWKLGYLKNEFPQRLFIPIFAHDGIMVGWSGRLIHEVPDHLEYKPPKYKHVKYFAKEKYLYGEHMIDKIQRTCFIMESFMDVLNLDQMGIKNCLAVMGASISAAQVDKVSQWFEKAVILPHDDEAGQKMAIEAKYALELAGVKVIISPIVPNKRQIDNEYRSPQDPGEWNIADVKWAFDVVRRIALESKPEACREETQESRCPQEATHGGVATEDSDSRRT